MAEIHFSEQIEHTKNYLLPFFRTHLINFETYQILEIGCAEAGFIKEMTLQDFKVDGLELEAHRAKSAKEKNPRSKIYIGDITNDRIVNIIKQRYDLIVMRDVIEHVSNKEKAILHCKKLLNHTGYLYLTFPPKYSPYGGHQQHCKSFIKVIPYLQILPKSWLRILGNWLHEDKNLIETIIRNFQLGFLITHFEKILKKHQLITVVHDLFIIRPIFKTRFGIRPYKMINIPWVRELLTLGCEYLIKKN